MGIARRLTRARPDWRVALPDLRFHGASPKSGPRTVARCAQDIGELQESLGVPFDALMGHSFGGKVALAAAKTLAPKQLWLIDSSPGKGITPGRTLAVFRALTESPGPFNRRSEAVLAIKRKGFSEAVARWLAMNLRRDPSGGLFWSIDPRQIDELMRDYDRRDLWPEAARAARESALWIVKASDSSVLSVSDVERARRWEGSGRIQTAEIEGGHWLHSDNPAGLHRLLEEALMR